jgi:sirohydrochlorin ferrochelatase
MYISGIMKAILLIDHGSRREEANEMLGSMAELVQRQVGAATIVRYAHMELAEPSIARGFGDCIEAGADEIIAFPYMLSPGKHSTADIPRLVAEAAAPYPGVRYRVTPAFGVHEKLGEIIAERAGVLTVSQEV